MQIEETDAIVLRNSNQFVTLDKKSRSSSDTKRAKPGNDVQKPMEYTITCSMQKIVFKESNGLLIGKEV